MKKWDIVYVILLVVTILLSIYNVYMGFFLVNKYPEFFKLQDKLPSIVIFSLVIIYNSVILISIFKKEKKGGICMSIFIMVVIVSVVVLMDRSSKILDKRIQSQKKTYQLMLATKADSIALISLKKKQVSEFSKLVKKLKENPFTFSLIKVELANGSDPIGMEKSPATVQQLSNWSSFNFIVITFPENFINGIHGILSIHCDNYDRENLEFFAKIKTVRKTPHGFIEKSIPYYMERTGKESIIPEIEKQKYALEAIVCALHAIKITVACDNVASALLHMEQEEKLGHKPPSVIITTEE